MDNTNRKIQYSIEPAALCAGELMRMIVKAGSDPVNEWFFYDGAFTSSLSLENGNVNTWQNENFVIIADKKIIAYIEAKWQRPLDIISNFRLILFDKTKAVECWKAMYDFFDYLFVSRGCQVFNWTVAIANTHAYKLYEAFIKRCCGHRVGIRHYAQKSYTGKISDIVLYEMTRDEYFEWKERTSNPKNE